MFKLKKGKSKPLVIEFFGLPGSGKTTLQSHLQEHLKSNSIIAATRKDLSYWLQSKSRMEKSCYLILNPIYTITIIVSLLRISKSIKLFSNDIFKNIISITTYPLYMNYYSNEKDVDIIILDQAVAQGIWSICISSNDFNKSLITKIFLNINILYKATFIFFEIDSDTSIKRILNRQNGDSRFDSIKSIKELNNMMRNGYEKMVMLKDLIRENKIPMMSIKTNNDVVLSARSLERKVMSVFNNFMSQYGNE